MKEQNTNSQICKASHKNSKRRRRATVVILAMALVIACGAFQTVDAFVVPPATRDFTTIPTTTTKTKTTTTTAAIRKHGIRTYCRSVPSFAIRQSARCWTRSIDTRLFDSATSATRDFEISVNAETAPVELGNASAQAEVGDTKSDIKALDVPMPTANGGYTHTAASRSKIGAANKGKTPWNKGKERSPEVKARIAAGVRAKNRERFLQKIADMGLTEEEYEAQKKEEKRRKNAERNARRTEKGGLRPTEETKAKISKILKEKHAKGEIKRTPVDPSKVRRGFTHSEETRRKISESLKKRYKADPTYKARIKKSAAIYNGDPETRARISNTLKQKWQEPEFRERMMERIRNRASVSRDSYGEDYKKKISEAMKKKWQDKEYRDKALKSIQAHNEKVRALRPKKAPKPKRVPKSKDMAVRLVQPRVAGEVKKKRTRTVKGAFTTSEDGTPVVKKRKAKKKAPAKKKIKKIKEPDGSVNRLREERRDLFDLLYGEKVPVDEYDDIGPSIQAYQLGDENLDDFDPYGLDDY